MSAVPSTNTPYPQWVSSERIGPRSGAVAYENEGTKLENPLLENKCL